MVHVAPLPDHESTLRLVLTCLAASRSAGSAISASTASVCDPLALGLPSAPASSYLLATTHDSPCATPGGFTNMTPSTPSPSAVVPIQASRSSTLVVTDARIRAASSSLLPALIASEMWSPPKLAMREATAGSKSGDEVEVSCRMLNGAEEVSGIACGGSEVEGSSGPERERDEGVESDKDAE